MELIKKRYLLKQPPNLQQIPGPQGPPGPSGILDLPLSTDDVDYRGEVLTDVLDDILYVALDITSFFSTPAIFEKGVVLTSLPLTWAYNKSIVSQSMASSAFASPPALISSERSKTVPINNATTGFIITLTGNDGVNNNSELAAVQFQNKVYWGGAIVPGVLNSAFILALQNEFSLYRQKQFTVNLGASTYAWFAYPASFGAATFKTNGFNGGFDAPTTVSFTNASGFTEDYLVYRSTNSNLGSTDVQVL